MEKHLKIVMERMFDIVGEDTLDVEIFTKEPDWYWKNEWTKEQEGNFKVWLLKYLLDNKEAREEFDIKFKTKTYLTKFINEFSSIYGWKYKN